MQAFMRVVMRVINPGEPPRFQWLRLLSEQITLGFIASVAYILWAWLKFRLEP
jgi:hypothetical protein